VLRVSYRFVPQMTAFPSDGRTACHVSAYPGDVGEDEVLAYFENGSRTCGTSTAKVELKVNLLALASGDSLVAAGEVAPRRSHADRLPRRRVRRAGGRVRARADTISLPGGHQGPRTPPPKTANPFSRVVGSLSLPDLRFRARRRVRDRHPRLLVVDERGHHPPPLVQLIPVFVPPPFRRRVVTGGAPGTQPIPHPPVPRELGRRLLQTAFPADFHANSGPSVSGWGPLCFFRFLPRKRGAGCSGVVCLDDGGAPPAPVLSMMAITAKGDEVVGRVGAALAEWSVGALPVSGRACYVDAAVIPGNRLLWAAWSLGVPS